MAGASPPGTACLIWNDGLLKRVVISSPACPRPRWGAKTSQMGVSYMIPSQIFNFPPQSVPNVPNSEENHPTATLGIVDTCLMRPHPHPTCYTTPPSHPAPS